MTLATSLSSRELRLACHVRAATQAREWSYQARSGGNRKMRRDFARSEAKTAREWLKLFRLAV